MTNDFEVRNLSVWYGSKSAKALDDVSFKLSNTHINIILGPNGSGKSSLLRCLAGIQNWPTGEIFHRGISRRVDVKNFNEDLILVSEEIALPSFKIKDLVRIYAEIWPTFDYQKFNRIIKFSDIALDKRSAQLSKGQRLLVQFALALATQCKTVLVDEVTAALDPYIRRRVAEELIAHQKALSATVVLATNIATEITEIEPYVLILQGGRVYLNGPMREIQRQFNKVKVADSNPLPGDAVLLTRHQDGARTIIFKNHAPAKVSDRGENTQPSLEEIFIYVSERRNK